MRIRIRAYCDLHKVGLAYDHEQDYDVQIVQQPEQAKQYALWDIEANSWYCPQAQGNIDGVYVGTACRHQWVFTYPETDNGGISAAREEGVHLN
jgi:hypothetical protein